MDGEERPPNFVCIAGLRALQGRKELDKLVKAVKAARDAMHWGDHGPPPLLVKVTPPPPLLVKVTPPPSPHPWVRYYCHISLTFTEMYV